MSCLTRTELMTPRKSKKRKIDLGQFWEGKHCWIKECTVADVRRIKEITSKNTGDEFDQMVQVVALVAADDDGNALLTEEDTKALIEQDSAIVQYIFDNAIEELFPKKEVEQAEKK